MSINWYKSIKSILKDEPELWLAYFYGQKLESSPHLTDGKPRYQGFFLQVLKFSYTVLGAWRPFQSYENSKAVRYMVFASTSNQMDSLDTTVDSLRRKNVNVTAIAARQLLNRQQRKERYMPLAINSLDVFKALVMVFLRGPYLYQKLKELHPIAARSWLADFLWIYVYLVYFHRVLSQLQPDFVITANDHSVPSRCMLSIAHQLGIKTVYLQHASVSNLFPALRMSYAFLDGQCALDTYRQCEDNQPETYRQVPVPKILLTGQKKPILYSDKTNNTWVGIALNSLDNINLSIKFIRKLADMGYKINIRWHPAQAEHDVREYRENFVGNTLITLSDPNKEPVSEFLSGISWLIAGNSSIHLEAALAGVASIYYELEPSNISDYYGYVRNGLAIEALSIEEVDQLIKSNIKKSKELITFVRHYSSTYQTKWEGKEGDLVAECLEAIYKSNNLPIPVLYL